MRQGLLAAVLATWLVRGELEVDDHEHGPGDERDQVGREAGGEVHFPALHVRYRQAARKAAPASAPGQYPG